MNANGIGPADAGAAGHHDSRTKPPPDEFANPPGVGGEVCEIEDGTPAEPCDPTEAEDLVLEESKPGYGISGYEGEEVGGG